MQKDELDTQINGIRALMAAGKDASVPEMRCTIQKIEEHRRTIWEAYGTSRGWTRAPEPFPVSALAPMTLGSEDWDPEFTDHRSFWTMAGRPVAITAHLYNCTQELRRSASTWAARLGLQTAFPTDYPSWWNPDRTTLIEITRVT